jgi:hypothetical protein
MMKKANYDSPNIIVAVQTDSVSTNDAPSETFSIIAAQNLVKGDQL